MVSAISDLEDELYAEGKKKDTDCKKERRLRRGPRSAAMRRMFHLPRHSLATTTRNTRKTEETMRGRMRVFAREEKRRSKRTRN
jgi:hypothetical protein